MLAPEAGFTSTSKEPAPPVHPGNKSSGSAQLNADTGYARVGRGEDSISEKKAPGSCGWGMLGTLPTGTTTRVSVKARWPGPGGLS